MGRMCHEPPIGIGGMTAVSTNTHCDGDRQLQSLAWLLVL